MALYSSILKIIPGADVSFINNSALVRGGAIFIDPGFQVRELVMMKLTPRFECFYQVMGSNDDGTACMLRFTSNSAKFGGGDVYGASFDLHVCPESCQLEISDSYCFYLL